jgi:hypothetical protein
MIPLIGAWIGEVWQLTKDGLTYDDVQIILATLGALVVAIGKLHADAKASGAS